MGSSLGGLLLDSLGWRWVFWINVLISVVAWLAARWVLPRTSDLSAPRPLDLPGVAFLVPGLAFPFLALHMAGHAGSSLVALAGYLLRGGSLPDRTRPLGTSLAPLLDLVDLNPVRAGLVNDPKDYF